MGENGAKVLHKEEPSIKEARELVAALCKQFYTLGWVSGTGGSISVKVNDPAGRPNGDRIIVMAPSGVQKERMEPEDMYVMAPDGAILSEPPRKAPPHKAPKCSECAPLFMKAYSMRGAGAVIHSHGMEACLATMIHPGAREFRITHMEMIKGIAGHGYSDELVVPIIENTAREYELTDSLAAAMEAYPKATAVLVRNHGLYVWGDSWIHAKTQAECYHYLFDAAVQLTRMGLDPADPLHGPLPGAPPAAAAGAVEARNGPPESKKLKRTQAPAKVLLDIEGTTTPIAFVADVLFPYARARAEDHLRATYGTDETQADITLLREQVQADLAAAVPGAVPVPGPEAGPDAVASALAANVVAMIAADRKVTALKQLQGHIWRGGYLRGELKGQVYPDVPQALAEWTSAGSKVYIYSSGSREAQRLIFQYSTAGDLRPFLSGFFDTTTGPKREARSYAEIALSLGVESPGDITFCTDIIQEAAAAKEAGLQVVLLSRPGNAPLPSSHEFAVVTSLRDAC